jgi:hypothetical protein
MEKISRREFARDTLGSLLTFSLINILSDSAAIAGPLRPVARLWVLEMSRTTKEMRAGSISQKQWQGGIEELLAKVDLSDLFRAIDYDALVKKAVFRPVHETVMEIDLARAEGISGELGFDAFFYAMKKGVDIVPHGHKNMSTMHMVLSGEAQALHYDKISEDGDHVMIKQVSDLVARPGDASTVSDESTNVHWFKTLSDRVFMFNIGVYSIDPAKAFTGREYVDPVRGDKEANGVIRSRKLSGDEAYKLYSGR